MVKAGEVYRSFAARDGQKVVLRAARWEDLDDLLDLINSIVEEGAMILRDRLATREEEADWLGRVLAGVEKGNEVYIVAEVGGAVVGSSSLSRRSGCRSHTGDVGIVIKEGFRNVGIGTEMIKTLLEEARRMGLKVLTLGVFATNEMAQHVYRKVGFREVGRIPKEFCRDGKYIDHVVMAMEL